MKKHTMKLLQLTAVMLLLLCSAGLAQHQPIWDDSLYSYVGVRIDKGPEQLEAVLSEVDVPVPGKYIIWANMVHDSGDEQLNESYYITVVHEDGTISTPLDHNAGPYKVISDYPGMTSDPVFENAGRFLLKEGKNTIMLHHYITIMDEYPQFLNGTMGGDTGEAESLYIQDSLFVIADPDVDGMINVNAWTRHEEVVNNKTEKSAYEGEPVSFRLKATNNYINDIRFGKMYGTLPDSLFNITFSNSPIDTINGQYVWDVPRLAPEDSFSVWVYANVSPVLPEGLLFQNAVGRLRVNSDIDTTNNLDGDHYWARIAPEIYTDMSIKIDAAPDSVHITGADTTKFAQRDEQVPFTLTMSNLLPDTARNVRVTMEIPQEITYTGSDITPTLIQPHSLQWDFGDIAPGALQSWTVQTTVNAVIVDPIETMETIATVFASNDTLLDNNTDSDVLHLYEKILNSDMAVTISATTDSTIRVNGLPEKAVIAGDEYNLQITVTNSGPDTAWTPELRTIRPDSVVFSNYNIPPKTILGDTLIWDLPPMNPAANMNINFTAYTAIHFDNQPFELVHPATISVDTDQNPANNSDSDRVFAINPEIRVDLGVTLTAVTDTSIVFNNQTEKAVLAGDAYQLDLQVTNAGPATAESSSLWTLLPDSVTVKSFTEQPTRISNDTLFWAQGPLAPNAQKTISMTVQTTSDFPVELFLLSHSATIETDQPDTNPANNTDNDHLYALESFDPIIIDMAISITTQSDTNVVIDSAQKTAVVGGSSYHYYMDITNLGTHTASTATISTVLPDSVSVVGYSLQPNNIDGKVLSWNVNSFSPSTQLIIILDIQSKRNLPAYPQRLLHTAQVTAAYDINTENNSDQTDIYVLEPSDTTRVDVWTNIISITKKTSSVNGYLVNTVYPGDSLDYVIRLGNLGPDAANQVTLSLDVPDYISLFGYSVEPETNNGTISWDYAQIPAGQETQVTFKAVLEEGTEDKEWIPAHVNTWLAQQDVNPNNNSDTDSVRVIPEPEPSRNFDARIAFTAMADSEYTDGNNTYPATIAGNIYQYQIVVTNDGPKPGMDITVTAQVPEIIELSEFSKISEAENALKWTIDSLGIGDSWNVRFSAQSPEELSSYPYPVPASSELSAVNDTVAANNTNSNLLYILEKPEEEIIDVAPVLSAETDSTGQVDGINYDFARESETYTYYLMVKNLGNRTAQSLRIAAAYPEQATLVEILDTPLTHATSQDSIIWLADSLQANAEITLGFTVKLPRFMPIGLNDLDCFAKVSAVNETPDRLTNNTDALVVKNFVKEPPPFVPEITILPEAIDITDSAKVSVRVPEVITRWDLRVLTPTGEILTDYADAFIEDNLLEPNMWYDIDDWYDQPYLYSGTAVDNLVFEIHAWNERGIEGVGQAPLIIRSGNHMVLDRNVFRPELEDYVDIRFKLSYERLARLDVYDVSGRLITTLTEDVYNGGWNSFLWNGRLTQDGRPAGSGVYLITLDAGDFKDWKKLIIVR